MSIECTKTEITRDKELEIKIKRQNDKHGIYKFLKRLKSDKQKTIYTMHVEIMHINLDIEIKIKRRNDKHEIYKILERLNISDEQKPIRSYKCWNHGHQSGLSTSV